RYGDDGVIGSPQHQVGARIAAGSSARGGDHVGVLAVEKELAAGKFVADLRKHVVPVLPAKAQRVLPDDPGEVVRELVILVVDLEWAAGRIAEAGQVLSQGDIGYAKRIWIAGRHRHAQFLVHVLLARQLLGDVVEQRVVAEPRLVHFGGGN